MQTTMSVNIDVNEQKIIGGDYITKRKAQVGRYLRRLRSKSTRADGKRLTCRDVADYCGLSAQTISNAERGTLNLTTLVILLKVYGAESIIEALSMFDDLKSDKTVPIGILKKINESTPLSATEFERVIAIYPDDRFEISFIAYRELLDNGLYTLQIVQKRSLTHYFASVNKDAK